MPKLTYPGSLRRKNGNRWKMTISVNGEKHYATCTAETKTEAADKITTWYDEVVEEQERRQQGVDMDRTLLQHISVFRQHEIPKKRTAGTRKDLTGLSTRLEYWLRRVEDRDPQVTRAGRSLFFRYLEWRAEHRWQYRPSLKHSVVIKAPVSLRTIQKERVMLHGLMKRACAEGIIDANPVAETEAEAPPDREPIIATREEVDALEGLIAGDMRKLYVRSLYETAARSESEVLWIRWQDLDLDGGVLRIYTDDRHSTKTHKARDIPLSRPFCERLKRHRDLYASALYGGRPSPWVFHHTNGRYLPPGSRIGTMRTAFDRAARLAGLPDGFGQHDLRHTRITHWLAEGYDQAWVQKVAGHEDPKTTDGYTHLAREHLRATMDRHEAGLDPALLQALLKHSDPSVRALAGYHVKQASGG